MKKAKRGASPVRGPWFAMSLAFLQSTACARLSPIAVKMFIDMCAQLGPGARGNGDLSCARSTMAPRGWTSNETRQAALQELEAAGLLVVTRRGGRNRCALYALTLWPLDCDLSKLEVGPGAYTTLDWERGGAERPSDDKPAAWRSQRASNPIADASAAPSDRTAKARPKNDSPDPTIGSTPNALTRSPGQRKEPTTPIDPTIGSVEANSGNSLTRPSGAYLDSHLLSLSSASPAAAVARGRSTRKAADVAR